MEICRPTKLRVDHADHHAAAIEERAAAIARIDHGVDLEHLAPRLGHDARHGALGDLHAGAEHVGERKAHRPDLFGQFHGFRIGQRERGEALPGDVEHGHVVRAVAGHHVARRGLVAQRHLDVGRAADDVIAGDQVTVGRDDEGRARSVPGLRRCTRRTADGRSPGGVRVRAGEFEQRVADLGLAGNTVGILLAFLPPVIEVVAPRRRAACLLASAAGATGAAGAGEAGPSAGRRSRGGATGADAGDGDAGAAAGVGSLAACPAPSCPCQLHSATPNTSTATSTALSTPQAKARNDRRLRFGGPATSMGPDAAGDSPGFGRQSAGNVHEVCLDSGDVGSAEGMVSVSVSKRVSGRPR